VRRQVHGRLCGKALPCNAIPDLTRAAIRISYNPNRLIVRLPTIGHEIVGNLFEILHASGTTYPPKYGASSIMMGGSADVQFRRGVKSPDFSLYDVKEGNPDSSEVYENAVPTIVFEVAYTQSARSVSFEAGRHICLTGGDVLLVVVIEVNHKRGSRPRQLETVTWSHWEEDVDSYRECVNEDGDEINVVHAEREEGEDEEEHVLPAASAFSALITEADGKLYRIRATRTARYQVCKHL
jgi:hypothetical protein